MPLSRRAFLMASLAAASGCKRRPRPGELLHASFDPTRELFEDINRAFAESSEPALEIRQSHGGSAKQARAVIDGLRADVVSLALGYDVDAISEAGLIAPDWRDRFPHRSSPFVSTIVLLVRSGNPKNVRDWDDLVKAEVSIVMPNPKTSGGARWTYLAAWAFAADRYGPSAAPDFVRSLYAHAPVLDAGARGATTSFVERNMGDVLIGWESDARLAAEVLRPGAFEIIRPARAILAEPPIAVVDRIVDARNTRRLAERYVEFLYEEAAQSIAEAHYFRRASSIKADPTLYRMEEVFTDWASAHREHFADGAAFDRAVSPS